MDITVLQNYIVLVVVGICVCSGYVIKKSITVIPNKYIPLIMAILGVVLNVWITMSFTPETLLGGLFSGLASTGLHQAFTRIIEGDKGK